jgi:hypothetical protein
VVKVLRVLFLEATLLFFVAVLGPWLRCLSQGNFGAARFWPATGQLFLLLVLPIFFLTLWSAQSKRYYKKVVHSYLVLANDNDVIMSHESTSNPASYRDLELITRIQADSGNVMDVSNGKGINNYEFSGAVSLAGRLLIADNETAKLVKPLNGVHDATEMALFMARVESGSKSVRISRAWPSFFTDWAVKKGNGESSFDDIESLAIRNDGKSGKVLYMMGSHSLDSEDRIRKERQVLIRIRLDTMGRPLKASSLFIHPKIYRELVPGLLHYLDSHCGALSILLQSSRRTEK